MSVSVRLSRNTRMYLPFWVAIPAYIGIAAAWLAIIIGWLIVSLVVIWPIRGIRALARSRSDRRAALDAQRPEAVAARKAAEQQKALERADHDSRTHRAVVSGCRIDPLKGGSFALSAEDMEMGFNVAGNAALHFLSLKNGDVVQVTLNPARTGLEEFWHLSRANGAKPRSPVDLSRADMEWFGLTAEAGPPRPAADP